MKIKILLFVLISLLGATAHAQQNDIIKPIKSLFDGMRAGNAEMIASAFAEHATMETYFANSQGSKVESSRAADFIQAAGQKHDVVWNEVIWSYDVRQDGPLATVWTEYTFYAGDQLIHCGVNAFQLLQEGDHWKITRVTDTRRKDNCKELDNNNSPEKIIQDEIDAQVWTPFKKAYHSFDAILMNDLHTNDFIRANAWRITVGDDYKKQNAKRYQEGRERGDKRSIEFYFDSRKATADHAVETGFYKVSSERNEKTSYHYGYFNVILKKQNGVWKIAYDWDTDNINGMEINEEWLREK